MEQIARLVDAGTLSGVSDVRDESDRDGMRVVVEVKRGGAPPNSMLRGCLLVCPLWTDMDGTRVVVEVPPRAARCHTLQAAAPSGC